MKKRKYNICAVDHIAYPKRSRNANADISCPVQKGEHTVVHTVTLPKEIPKGSDSLYLILSTLAETRFHVAPFVVNVRGYTVDDEPMVCLDLKIDFRTPRGGFW